MTPERLDMLEFQTEHKGLLPRKVEEMRKRGVSLDDWPHGAMIVVTPREMRALLDAYRHDG